MFFVGHQSFVSGYGLPASVAVDKDIGEADAGYEACRTDREPG